MIITSRQNSLIKQVAALNGKKYRKEAGLYLIEGIKPVKEYLSCGFKAEKIICTEHNLSLFPSAVAVSDGVFKGISSEESPQGVIAVAKIPENILRPPENPCILLDCLQDPGNVGTVIRTANAAGFLEIYLINCTDPYSPKAVRASMGGIFHTKIYTGNYTEISNALKDVPLICTDMDGEDIFAFAPPERFCLCIGNEGGGISGEVKNNSAYTVKIPMRSTCESLNAAVAAGIAMYTIKNSMRGKQCQDIPNGTI